MSPCQRHNITVAVVVGVLAIPAALMGYFISPDYYIPAGMLAFASWLMWWTRPHCNA